MLAAPPALPALAAALWVKNKVKSNCLLLNQSTEGASLYPAPFGPKSPRVTRVLTTPVNRLQEISQLNCARLQVSTVFTEDE